jgi:hypothetical protein
MLLAACTMAPPQPLDPPTPAMLTAVRNLAPYPCNATTAMALDRLGVPSDRIRAITYDRRTSGNKSYLQGYDSWVQVSDQSGDLVIRHSRSCRFIASYRQG